MTADPLSVAVGDQVPPLVHQPDEVDLFSFSAASWLLHRIHYDQEFTTEHDGHPALVIHGPLQGTWLIQSVQRWLGIEARPVSISYRHSAPAYAGETLTTGGTVTALDAEAGTFTVDLHLAKPDPEGGDPIVTTSGTAIFERRVT